MAMLGLPGGMEWVIILGIILLLFGPTQLPKLAKSLGKSAKSLREGMESGGSDDEDDDSAESGKKSSSKKSSSGDDDEE